MGGHYIKNDDKKCIISIYVNEGWSKIEKKLYEVVEECMKDCELVILCGDMNAKIREANAEVSEECEEEKRYERKSQDKKVNEEETKVLR